MSMREDEIRLSDLFLRKTLPDKDANGCGGLLETDAG